MVVDFAEEGYENMSLLKIGESLGKVRGSRLSYVDTDESGAELFSTYCPSVPDVTKFTCLYNPRTQVLVFSQPTAKCDLEIILETCWTIEGTGRFIGKMRIPKDVVEENDLSKNLENYGFSYVLTSNGFYELVKGKTVIRDKVRIFPIKSFV